MMCSVQWRGRVHYASMLLVCIMVAYPSQAQVETPQAPAPPDLNTLVDQLRSLTGTPGLVVAVGSKSGPIQTFASGEAVVEHHVPVSAETRFRLASTSKAVTAVVLASLWDRGILSIDDAAGTYLPELPEHLQSITPRQLAGHLGGIRAYRPEDLALELQRWDTARAALEIFTGDPLQFEPGEAYHYSTFGYTLLSAIMEAASGMTFEEALQHEIAEPLGLDTLVRDDPRQVIPNRTEFYERAAGGALLRAPFLDPSYKVGGGGLLGSAGDLARLGRALMNGKILSERARRTLFEPQRTNSGEETGVGLGWRIGTDPLGLSVWHHEGSMSGARSAVLLYPESSTTIVLLSNLSTTPFFAFETAAALAASRNSSGAPRCPARTTGTYTGTVDLDGTSTTAEITLHEESTRLRGTLQLGEISLPVATSVPIVDGWCLDGDPVLVLAVGPNWGLLPLPLRHRDGAWHGDLMLQGDHRLTLKVSR